MANKIFFDITETETHYEYHTNADQQLVQDKAAMSSRIEKTSPEAAKTVVGWFEQAKQLGFVSCWPKPKSRATTKVYFDIFEAGGRYEYPANNDKKLVAERSSMCRSIDKDSPLAAKSVIGWLNEVRDIALIHCPTFG